MRKRLMKLQTPGTVVLFLAYLLVFSLGFAAMFVYLGGLWNLS